PSENELCRELKVSRVTLRDALRELVRGRLLVKAQGKGTLVSDEPPKLLAPVKYAGFLESLQERVLKLKIAAVDMQTVPASAELPEPLKQRVLKRKTAPVDMQPAPAPAELIATLRLRDGAEVTRIRRLRHVDNEPFSWTVNYVPLDIGARIREKELHSVPLL